jgi:aspartyl/asparaginyl-tRNA synthetase
MPEDDSIFLDDFDACDAAMGAMDRAKEIISYAEDVLRPVVNRLINDQEKDMVKLEEFLYRMPNGYQRHRLLDYVNKLSENAGEKIP